MFDSNGGSNQKKRQGCQWKTLESALLGGNTLESRSQIGSWLRNPFGLFPKKTYSVSEELSPRTLEPSNSRSSTCLLQELAFRGNHASSHRTSPSLLRRRYSAFLWGKTRRGYSDFWEYPAFEPPPRESTLSKATLLFLHETNPAG